MASSQFPLEIRPRPDHQFTPSGHPLPFRTLRSELKSTFVQSLRDLGFFDNAGRTVSVLAKNHDEDVTPSYGTLSFP